MPALQPNPWPRRREGPVQESRLGHAIALVASLLAVGLIVAGCPGAASGPNGDGRQWARGRTLRVACFGGSVEEQAKLLVGSLVEAMSGAKVDYVRGTSHSHDMALRKAKGSAPPFDVAYLDGIVQDQAIRADVLEKLDPAAHPFLADLDTNAKIQVAHGPGVQFFTVGLCYDKDALAEAKVPPLASWADLWRFPALKGRVGVPNISHTAGVDFLLMAARLTGEDPTQLEGLKAGIAKIKALAPPIVYRSLGKLQKAFESRTVWAAPLYNSRAYAFVDAGLNVAFLHPREKGFGHVTTLNIAQGTPNRDLAQLYLNVALSPAVQVAQAIGAPYGPTNRSVIPVLGAHPTLTQRLPLGPDDFAELMVPDWEPVNRVRDELEKAWYEAFPEGAR